MAFAQPRAGLGRSLKPADMKGVAIETECRGPWKYDEDLL